MSIKARGGDYVTLDGDQHPVLLTLRGLGAAEDALPYTGVDNLAGAIMMASVKAFNVVLVECLVDGGMTRERAQDLTVTAAEFQAAYTVIKELVMQLFPKKAEAGDGEKPTKKKTSGPTG